MAVNKARAQLDAIMELFFLLQISGGTVSIEDVAGVAADDISVSDGGAGLSTITIKNFKGQKGKYNIQLTPKVTSMMSAVITDSYTGDDLAFTVSTENDASSLTDNVPVFVHVVAY